MRQPLVLLLAGQLAQGAHGPMWLLLVLWMMTRRPQQDRAVDEVVSSRVRGCAFEYRDVVEFFGLEVQSRSCAVSFACFPLVQGKGASLSIPTGVRQLYSKPLSNFNCTVSP